jgi:hypothetical protein
LVQRGGYVTILGVIEWSMEPERRSPQPQPPIPAPQSREQSFFFKSFTGLYDSTITQEGACDPGMRAPVSCKCAGDERTRRQNPPVCIHVLGYCTCNHYCKLEARSARVSKKRRVKVSSVTSLSNLSAAVVVSYFPPTYRRLNIALYRSGFSRFHI